MIILSIETSCDETAAAVLTNDQKRITILSNVVASSTSLQAKYGGVIPEQAAREQLRSIMPVIEEALAQAFSKNRLPRRFAPRNDKMGIDAIAVTYGPGLIGSLLVGVETAKTLSLVWNKPLIPVNHLIGHFYANWIIHLPGVKAHLEGVPSFPCLGLLVSGGHTELVLFTNHGKYKYLGGTRDDASGECFDKCARLLGLPYPGGPEIAKLAQKGNPKAFDLPRPMIDSKDFDFSFSGLKTAVANLVHTSPVILSTFAPLSVNSAKNLSHMQGISNELRDPSLIVQDDRKGVQDDNVLTNLAASIEAAIVDVLVTKTIKAAQMYKVNQIMIAGGVAANQKLVSEFKKTINDKQSLRSDDLKRLTINLHVPPPELCTDNAAMIAAAAFFNYQPINPLKLQVNPNLSLENTILTK